MQDSRPVAPTRLKAHGTMHIIEQKQDFESWLDSLESHSDDSFDIGVPGPGLGGRRVLSDGTWTTALMPSGKDYQGKIWRFPDGTMEISVTRVEAMQRMAQSRYWLLGQPIRTRPVLEEEMTLEELEAEALAKKQENLNRAARRAAQKVRHLIKMIGADHMLTLSYRANMEDVEQLKKDWKAFVRLMHARYPKWKFVAIRERQERGALHLHVAVSGKQDIKYIRRCWYMALGSSPSVTGEDTPGQIDVRAPWKRWGGTGGYVWAPDKLAAYLTKYLSKTFAEEAEMNAKRYWHSKDVKAPEPVKVWLGATSVFEAIEETHNMLHGETGNVSVMWLKEGWGAIWMSG